MLRFLPLITIKNILDAIVNAITWPLRQAMNYVIQPAFSWIINTVLMPALEGMYTYVIEPIMQIILTIASYWLHIKYLKDFIFVLRGVDLFEEAFNIFAGISDVTVRTGGQPKKDFLLNVLFTNSVISKAFWSITLLAFGVSMIFGIISIMKSSIDLDGKRPVGKAIGALAKTGLTFLIIPLFCLFVLNLSNVIIRKTNEILSGGVGKTPSIGTIIFLSTTLEAGGAFDETFSALEMGEKLEEFNKEQDSKNYTDIKQAALTDAPRDQYYLGNKHYWNIVDVMSDFNVLQIKTLMGLAMAIFVFVVFIFATFIIICRIFEVIVLYLVSPFFVATIALDDGEKFNEWKNMFIAKLFSGFGLLIAMKVYILLVPVIMDADLELSGVPFLNLGLKAILVCGGAFAMIKCNTLIMQILNVNVARADDEKITNLSNHLQKLGNHGKEWFSGKLRSVPGPAAPAVAGGQQSGMSNVSNKFGGYSNQHKQLVPRRAAPLPPKPKYSAPIPNMPPKPTGSAPIPNMPPRPTGSAPIPNMPPRPTGSAPIPNMPPRPTGSAPIPNMPPRPTGSAPRPNTPPPLPPRPSKAGTPPPLPPRPPKHGGGSNKF